MHLARNDDEPLNSEIYRKLFAKDDTRRVFEKDRNNSDKSDCILVL